MASPQQPPPPPPPTLRVMRLYRPSAPRPGSSALILPESFGNIYAGEPFVAYVAVTNGGPRPLRDVLVTAKLQAPSAKRAVDLPAGHLRFEARRGRGRGSRRRRLADERRAAARRRRFQ